MQVVKVYNWLIGKLNFGGEKISSRFRLPVRVRTQTGGNDIKGEGNDASLINTDTR